MPNPDCSNAPRRFIGTQPVGHGDPENDVSVVIKRLSNMTDYQYPDID